MSNDLRKFYLNEMGIETWVRRNSNLNFEKLNLGLSFTTFLLTIRPS